MIVVFIVIIIIIMKNFYWSIFIFGVRNINWFLYVINNYYGDIGVYVLSLNLMYNGGYFEYDFYNFFGY